MSAAAKAIASGGLKRRALSLGAVKAFDHAMQFLLPVVLVRCLDAHTFGEYRLLWLVVGTLLALASLNVPGSLYYFLPRSDAPTKRLYVHHTLLYLAVAGLACGALVSPWNPLLPEAMRPLTEYGLLVPSFIALWIASALLDTLPTIDERIAWQARASVAIAVSRFVVVAGGAWFTGSLEVVLWLLLAVVVFKAGLLLYYVRRHHGAGGRWLDWKLFGGHVRYAVPFGISSAFYTLRLQADQWVAATLFALHSFAAFSLAAVIGQLVNIFRMAVLEAFLPSMSRLEAKGDVAAVMDLNSRGNVMVATLLYPLLGLAFTFAEDIVRVVYTAGYLEAAPVMRVYTFAMALMVVETGSMVLLLRQGPYALKVSSVVLAISVLVSWVGASTLGLAGAAAGSVTALYLDRILILQRISAHSGIPLARLQRWGSLLWLLSVTVVASFAAWMVVRLWFADSPSLVRLAVGAAAIGLLYFSANAIRSAWRKA